MAFNRFFSSDISQTANSSSFTNVFGDDFIDLPGVEDLSSLSEESEQMVRWVRYKLGEPVLYVELDNKQIFAAFEEANIRFSALVNTFQIRNWLTNMYGLSRNFDTNDLTNKLPYNSFNFLKRQIANVGAESPLVVGGTQNVRKAYINIDSSTQDYDLYQFTDGDSNASIRDYLTSVSGSANSLEIDLKKVWHYSAITLYRFYDPFSSINLLSQEFNFESFNTETIFYVLPLWNDILRAMQLNLNDKVRRSNYSYVRNGNILRLYPKPLRPMKLWIEFTSKYNAFAPQGSLSADPSLTAGVSNLSNVPFKDLKYEDINPLSRNWVRQFTFALCLEELGRIRRKFRSIPIPNGDVTLDGDMLVSEGVERQIRLETDLRGDLEKLTNTELMRQEAEQQAIMNRELSYIPSGIYFM